MHGRCARPVRPLDLRSFDVRRWPSCRVGFLSSERKGRCRPPRRSDAGALAFLDGRVALTIRDSPSTEFVDEAEDDLGGFLGSSLQEQVRTVERDAHQVGSDRPSSRSPSRSRASTSS